MIDLQAIFGDGPAVAKAVVPEPAAAVLGDRLDTAADPLAALPFAEWVLRPDCHGRMGWQAPGLAEAVPFDALDLPGPACPVCGSLEQWQDLLGHQRCGACEADALNKALELANKAARLRSQAPPRKPALRIAPGCVAAGRVDTLDLDNKRSLQRPLAGLGGA